MLGIDIAKTVFQLHGLDENEKCILRKKMSSKKMFELIARIHPCTIAMEACAGSHHLSRKFSEYGHEVKMIAAQFVKPFVKTNKSDSADAEAITDAVWVDWQTKSADFSTNSVY